MNGPNSKLAKVLFSSNEKKKILVKMKSSDSFFGTRVEIGGKTYVVTSGDTSSEIEDLKKEIEDLIHEPCS